MEAWWEKAENGMNHIITQRSDVPRCASVLSFVRAHV